MYFYMVSHAENELHWDTCLEIYSIPMVLVNSMLHPIFLREGGVGGFWVTRAG